MDAVKDKDFINFRGLIDNWISGYEWGIYTYIALKTIDGFRLLFGRVIFEPNGINDIKPLSFEADIIKVGQFACKITPDIISAILESSQIGEMLLPDEVQRLAPDGERFSTYYSPISHPSIEEGLRLPSLIIRGDSKHNLIAKTGDATQLDWKLKAADIPFYNMDDLLAYYGLPGLWQMGDSTTYEIVARSPAYILGTSIIKDGVGIVECHIANNLDVRKLKVGYKIIHKGPIERGSTSGDQIGFSPAPGFKKGQVKINVKDAAVMQAFLSYEGVALHQWWILDPVKQLNARYAVHQVFDRELDQLKDILLKPDKNKSDMFEHTISLLFNLLGFSAATYGRIPKLQDGPDIIAVTPAGHFCVIECTTGLLDEKDKLAKLVQRTRQIREKLEATGHSYLKTQAVIVTPLSRNQVEANLETAGKHNIAVICKEDIEKLIQEANLPSNPDAFLQAADKLIPNVNQEPLFRS